MKTTLRCGLLLASLFCSANLAIAQAEQPAPPPPPPPPPKPSAFCIAHPYDTDPNTGLWCGWVPERPGTPDCSRLVC